MWEIFASGIAPPSGLDIRADALQVAASDPRLHQSSDRTAEACERVGRTREGHNLKGDLTIWCSADVERLLALLGMAGKRPVGEPVGVIGVSDGDDAARDHNRGRTDPQHHDYVGPNRDRGSLGNQSRPNVAVRLPGLDG